MLRVIGQSLRNAAFKGRRQKLIECAGAHDGLLKPVGEGLLLPDVRRFSASVASGAYEIYVAVPSAPPPPAGWPVLSMLDGNAWIAGAAEALAWQSRFAPQSEIDPPLIFAVGYPGADPFDLGRRAYDYLPKHTSGKLSQRFMQGAPWHQPGGADEFLDFLTGPLRADIAARFPTDPSRHALCGHSFGGLFALRTLLMRPGSFSRFVALSPSLWWDDGQLIGEADALIAALPRDLATSVLIAVGERETPDRPSISDRMIADAAAFAGKLAGAGQPDLEVEYRVLEGENHQSVPTAALSAMLRFATGKRG